MAVVDSKSLANGTNDELVTASVVWPISVFARLLGQSGQMSGGGVLHSRSIHRHAVLDHWVVFGAMVFGLVWLAMVMWRRGGSMSGCWGVTVIRLSGRVVWVGLGLGYGSEMGGFGVLYFGRIDGHSFVDDGVVKVGVVVG
jgi:hypothetical protein